MPRWEPDARIRLVEAALHLFEEQGYEETTVAEIAARAGLTKTTFFRHFPDKREVLAAGQEVHSQLLADAIADAPGSTTAPLELVAAAIDALASSFGPERREFSARVHRVVAAHSELRERDALKSAGYTAAIADALRHRDVSDTTATVAADLGVLAFKLAFAGWTETDAPAPLADLTREKLDEIRTVSGSLAAAEV